MTSQTTFGGWYVLTHADGHNCEACLITATSCRCRDLWRSTALFAAAMASCAVTAGKPSPELPRIHRRRRWAHTITCCIDVNILYMCLGQSDGVAPAPGRSGVPLVPPAAASQPHEIVRAVRASERQICSVGCHCCGWRPWSRATARQGRRPGLHAAAPTELCAFLPLRRCRCQQRP